MIVCLYAPGQTVDVQYRVGPAVDPPAGSLRDLVAAMASDEWRELTNVGGVDAVLAVGEQGVMNRLPFSNSAARDGVAGRIMFVGSDHLAKDDTPQARALTTFTDSANAWATTFYTHDPNIPANGLGSHNYQHVACDPTTGDVYLHAVVGEQMGTLQQHAAAHIYRSLGGTQPFQLFATCPENLSQISFVALAWWRGAYVGSSGRGVLTLHCGNQGSIHVLDPFPGVWLKSSYGQVPGQSGTIHVVSAYSGPQNCLVFGGGTGRKVLRQLNADGTVSPLPDAPHAVGIFSGCNFVGDGVGRFLANGFGELWRLDIATGWTQLPGPVPTVDPAASTSVISCDLYDLGAAAYIDYLGARSPKVRMWVHKA